MNRRLMWGGLALVVVALAGGAVLVGAGDPDEDAGVEPTEAATSSPSSPTAPTATTATDPTLLLPNMRSLNASEIQLEDRSSVRRLRFAASLANLGPGPLLLDPRGRLGCARNQIAADQLVHADADDDQRFTRGTDRVAERRRAGCMLIHPDPDHDHWHFDAMASYELRDPGGEVVSARRKISFCLRDNARVPGAEVVVRREYFGECGRTLVQGISPGWVDIYSADLAGQGLPIPRDLRGVHCLTLRADPRKRIVETDETDNARTIAVVIGAFEARRSPSPVCG
jgi:hypothetical protein